MELELKEYQSRALSAFERWLTSLGTAREESAEDIAYYESRNRAVPDDASNYPRKAWEQLQATGAVAASAGGYVARTDDAGRPIPHVCFKVPTGGGKTLLAAAALERMNRPTGLTLWIVPTRAIYQQTKDALWNREHPYRQMLERASCGRVKLLEKETRFTRSDVENYLCVLLLMLPAAHRQRGREFLRMFRDSGRYPSFFPDGDNVLGDQGLLNTHPDLERLCVNPNCLAKQDRRNECRCGEQWKAGPAKRSLFNVFKMLRPVVVLDEAHKAYGSDPDEFVKSVNRLDPLLVIELSATPNPRISNLLVDISGVDLKDEEMIKLPVQVETSTHTDWKDTLARAKERMDELDQEAEALFESDERYVRPIAVVRVERTGKEQRDGERVHAEDVREALTAMLGVPPEAVKVKSAENDEIGREDLFSVYCPVRWIITKAALMEGWDCSFAYVLVMLDNTRSSTALTQLTGRVMRMPHARRTGREALDQSYVHCHNADVGKVVAQVKAGLEHEGLTGLGDNVLGKGVRETKQVSVAMREQFRGEDIFLPRVLHQEGQAWVELDYDRHILPAIPWGALTPPEPQLSQPDQPRRDFATVDIGKATEYREEAVYVDKTVSATWFARRLADIVPNPWQAARVASMYIDSLRQRGVVDDAIFDQRISLSSTLRREVFEQVDQEAQSVFQEKLKHGQIRFDLEATGDNYQLRDTYPVDITADDAPLHDFGRQLQLNLYEPMFERSFDSDLERSFARYTDAQKALKWWHRVAARQRNEYYLRGWRRDRIFPDFVALAERNYGGRTFLLFETKGEHLRGNDDTQYKKKVLDLLENAFNRVYQGGSLVLRQGAAKGSFHMVFREEDFPAAFASLSVGTSAAPAE